MQILIDTDARTMRVTENADSHQYPLFGCDALRVLSREWLRLTWNLGYWSSFSWLGRQILQLPDDILRLAELVWRVQPDVIVETGTYQGGTALLFAALCRMRGRGRVISIDTSISPDTVQALTGLAGDRITLVEGDSSSPETARGVRAMVGNQDSVLVFLDSDHSSQHVRRELENYSPLILPGGYLIVADSICADLADTPAGERAWRDDNPSSAVEAFLKANSGFARVRPLILFPTEHDFTDISYWNTTWLQCRSSQR